MSKHSVRGAGTFQWPSQWSLGGRSRPGIGSSLKKWARDLVARV